MAYGVIVQFRLTGLYQTRLWFSEITSPSPHGSMMTYQPFINQDRMKPSDIFLLGWAQQHGAWTDWLSAEQTAYALGQVTAAKALPTLTEYVSIAALLDSRIKLREYLDPALVDAITSTLHHHSQPIEWKQVDASCFAYVVGAGVAACIDTISGDETLYLRYANAVADAIAAAKSEADLPRSLLGLQNNLQECIDQLLVTTRRLTLQQLTQ